MGWICKQKVIPVVYITSVYSEVIIEY